MRLAALVLSASSVVLLAACGGSSSPRVSATTAARRAPTKPLSFPALVAKVRTGVIEIDTITCQGAGVGTGILVGPRLVATVEHVTDGAASITLLRDGKVVGHATVVGFDAARDIALVRSDTVISGYRFRFSSRAPLLGENVAAIGFPLGLPLTVTRGSVSGLDRTIPINGVNRNRLVQTDAPVNPGNSGGPLITDSGAVVGLVDLGTNKANALAFAVSANVAGPLIQSWSVAPQPIANQTCSTPLAAPAPPNTQAGPQSYSTYTGSDFSIDYPADWVVSHLSESGGNLDNTFQPQGGGGPLMRVDENPSNTATTVQAAAAPVIYGLQGDPTYSAISITQETFDGVPALRWEFQNTVNGVQLHTIDEFFIDAQGRGWGVLIQAPESAWAQDAAPLDALRQTFALTASPNGSSLPGPSGQLYLVTHNVVIRDGPRTSANQLGEIPAGAMVGVQCKTAGDVVYGLFGPDKNWNRVTFNGITGFVTDEWLDTKHDESDPTLVPPCGPSLQASGDWPGGSGYTAILASVGTESEARAIRSKAAAAGLDAGILFSSNFSSLQPGYWVVFSGMFSTQPEAARQAVRAKSLGFGDAYSRFVSP